MQLNGAGFARVAGAFRVEGNPRVDTRPAHLLVLTIVLPMRRGYCARKTDWLSSAIERADRIKTHAATAHGASRWRDWRVLAALVAYLAIRRSYTIGSGLPSSSKGSGFSVFIVGLLVAIRT